MRIDQSYDIPYLAGYSVDGKTIYIDRHMPATLKVDGKTIRIVDFLLESHEATEKRREEEGESYPHAHKDATHIEHSLALKAGISPTAYEKALAPHIAMAYRKIRPRLPTDLDPQPYLGDPKFHFWFK